MRYVASGLYFALGLAAAAVAIVAFLEESKQSPVGDLRLAAPLTLAFGFIVNPVKFVEEVGPLFVAAMDIFLGLASATLTFAELAESA